MIEHPDRRRSPRRSCIIISEVRVADQTYRTQCETTDISTGGCYMKTLFPMPVGVVVNIIIWADKEKLEIEGVVKTADPGLGNGVEFTAMSDETRARLHGFLERLEIAEPGEEFTIFSLAHHVG